MVCRILQAATAAATGRTWGSPKRWTDGLWPFSGNPGEFLFLLLHPFFFFFFFLTEAKQPLNPQSKCLQNNPTYEQKWNSWEYNTFLIQNCHFNIHRFLFPRFHAYFFSWFSHFWFDGLSYVWTAVNLRASSLLTVFAEQAGACCQCQRRWSARGREEHW